MPRTTDRMAGPRRLAGLFAILAVFLVCLPGAARAGEFVVLVNAENPIDTGESAKGQVARLFLKRASEWPSGARAFPFDRPADSAAHTAFVRNVLDATEARLDDWWLKLKQERGETPPREVGSVSFLIRAIKRKAGAFGFARKNAVDPVPEGIKVLFEFDVP